MSAHVSAHHQGAFAHALAVHTQLFHHVLEDLALCPSPCPSHQHHSLHSMPIYSISSNYHQPTHTSPSILPAPTSLMPSTTYHHHSSLALSCTQATKSTHKAIISQASIAMHHLIGSAPPVAAQRQNPFLPTMALLCHGLGASCGARCLYMLPFIMFITLNPVGGPSLSLSKSN